MHRTIGSLLAVAALTVGAVGCSSGSDGKIVKVELGDFSIKPEKSTIAAGETTFKLHNGGGLDHEVVMFKVDSVTDLKTKESGEVDEEATPEKLHMGEVEGVKPGTTKEWTLDLAEGKYVIFCNLDENGFVHFKKGMYAELNVSK